MSIRRYDIKIRNILVASNPIHLLHYVTSFFYVHEKSHIRLKFLNWSPWKYQGSFATTTIVVYDFQLNERRLATTRSLQNYRKKFYSKRR